MVRMFVFVAAAVLGGLMAPAFVHSAVPIVAPTVDGHPPKLDCTFVGAVCQNPSQDCTTYGGVCQANGQGSRWHDGETGPADNCGCLV